MTNNKTAPRLSSPRSTEAAATLAPCSSSPRAPETTDAGDAKRSGALTRFRTIAAWTVLVATLVLPPAHQRTIHFAAFVVRAGLLAAALAPAGVPGARRRRARAAGMDLVAELQSLDAGE